eukprot:11239313-Alexandrium_andersonii.AAC.1
MSASLVGSEMCIRDRVKPAPAQLGQPVAPKPAAATSTALPTIVEHPSPATGAAPVPPADPQPRP